MTTTPLHLHLLPPKYYDKLGREYSSQADRDAANERIDAQRARLDTAFNNLTTDQEYDTLKLQNPDLFAFDDLPEDEVRKKFDEQKILAYEDSKLQTKNLSDDIGRSFQNLDQTALQNLTYDQISEGLGDYSRLSEDTQRNIFDTMLKTAVREARFTLTPEEVDAFARTAITAASVGDATAPTVGEIAPADQVQVDEVAAPDRVVVGEIGELNRDLIDKVVEGEDQLADYLLQRVRGEATSSCGTSTQTCHRTEPQKSSGSICRYCRPCQAQTDQKHLFRNCTSSLRTGCRTEIQRTD